jgi:hypothetical protein
MSILGSLEVNKTACPRAPGTVMGGYPSGQRGLTVNQLAKAYGGSNPSPPTWMEDLSGGFQGTILPVW